MRTSAAEAALYCRPYIVAKATTHKDFEVATQASAGLHLSFAAVANFETKQAEACSTGTRVELRQKAEFLTADDETCTNSPCGI